MTSRTPLIAANWKMYPRPEDLGSYKPIAGVDAIVFPTVFDLAPVIEAGLTVGAQYGHASDTGAHTGDISMAMLKEQGCTHVLCGHSERRQYHYETNAFIAQQVESALRHGLHPILCIGETWEEKETGKGKEIIKEQFEIAYTKTDGKEITIAYEPVWAISGGDASKLAATPEEAEEMHAFIRDLLPKEKQESTRIVYGGSMKPENCEQLLAQKNIDGGLVGGASLHPEKFKAILEAAKQ